MDIETIENNIQEKDNIDDIENIDYNYINSGLIKNGIFCQKCFSFYLIKSFEYSHDKEEILINLFCNNGHYEQISISDIINNYQNPNQKLYSCNECQVYYKDREKIFICPKCEKIFCLNCKKKHAISEASNFKKKNFKNKIKLKSLFFLDKCCHSKNYEKFCNDCNEYLCKKCFDENDEHINHDIINLPMNQKSMKKDLENIIKDEENLINEKNDIYNQLLIKARNNFSKYIEHRKKIVELKRLILYSYQVKSQNYHQLKNLDLIKQNFLQKDEIIKSFYNLSEILDKYNNNQKGDNNLKNFLLENNFKINNDNNKSNNNIFLENRQLLRPIFKQDVFQEKQIIIKNGKDVIINTQEIKRLEKNKDNIEKTEPQEIKISEKLEKNNINIDKNEDNSNSENAPAPLCANLENNNDNNLALGINYNLSPVNSEEKNKLNDNVNNNNIVNKLKFEDCSKYIQIFNDQIRKVLVIDENYLIILFECNPPNLFFYCLNKDIKKNAYKLQSKLSLFFKHENFNDINKFPDNSILLCTNNIIKKIKFIDFVNSEYIVLFNLDIRTESDKYLQISKMDICLPLYNNDFITINRNLIYIWFKQKNKNKRKESYAREKIEIKSAEKFFICAGKEVSYDLILFNIYKTKKDDDYDSYLINFELWKDEFIDLNKKNKNMLKLDRKKNSIKQLNQDYAAINLFEGGYILYNISQRKIDKTIKEYNFYLYENNFMCLDNYVHIIEIKKYSKEDEIYELSQSKIKNINLSQNFNDIEIKKEQLELKNIQIKDVVVFTSIEEKEQNKKQILFIIIIFDNKIMILDYP